MWGSLEFWDFGFGSFRILDFEFWRFGIVGFRILGVFFISCFLNFEFLNLGFWILGSFCILGCRGNLHIAKAMLSRVGEESVERVSTEKLDWQR